MQGQKFPIRINPEQVILYLVTYIFNFVIKSIKKIAYNEAEVELSDVNQ